MAAGQAQNIQSARGAAAVVNYFLLHAFYRGLAYIDSILYRMVYASFWYNRMV